MRAAQGGDEAAFGRLVDRYKDTVFATVVAITGDFDAAHDIAQETFLRAWFGIARLQDAERAERHKLVRDAIDRLPELSREALILHYLEGLTTPRMATQLGITEPTVRQRSRRARLLMQEEVEQMVADVIRDEAPDADFSENVSILLKQARGLSQKVRYTAAVPVLESAREQAPEDTLVSMLLAEAYTFNRSAEDLLENPAAYDRALSLLDEVLEAAKGGPFEAVAQLELARRHLTRMQADKALVLYDELLPKFPWMVCVLHSEIGVAQAILQDGAAALGHFERAVELTTADAMKALQATSKELMGEAYWAFWSTVDNLPVRQCQNHAWIAGLGSAAGDMETARAHVRLVIDFVHHDEVGDARDMLRRELVNRMEQMFPDLAATEEGISDGA